MFKILMLTLTFCSISTFSFAQETKNPKNEISSRFYEIDSITGFHYLSYQGFRPRYCLTTDNKRGHLMTKDNKLFCVPTN